MHLSFLTLLAILSLRDCVVLSFEYETTEFTSAVFNYSYTKENKRYIASSDAIDYYRGKFGALNEQLILPLAGHIYTPYKNFDGCSYDSADDADILDDPMFNNVIVVVRKGGQCSLWDKIVEAARQNFSGLIEYDSDPAVNMENLKGDYDPDKVDFGPSEIVYALATHTAGKFFETLYLNGTHPHISIAAGQTTIMRLAISRTSVLFVAVSFIVLTLISLVWLVFYYIQRFRFIHNRDRTKKRLAAAAKKALTILQVRTLKKGDNELETEEVCSICIEDFVAGDVIRELPCTHKFHKTCVDPWLISKHNCPNCKINVLKSLQLVDKYDLEPEETEDGAEENVAGPQTQSTEMNGRRSMRAGPSNGGPGGGGPSAPPLSVVVFDNLNYPAASCSSSNANAAITSSAEGSSSVTPSKETARSPNEVFLVVPPDSNATNEQDPLDVIVVDGKKQNDSDCKTLDKDEGNLSEYKTGDKEDKTAIALCQMGEAMANPASVDDDIVKTKPESACFSGKTVPQPQDSEQSDPNSTLETVTTSTD